MQKNSCNIMLDSSTTTAERAKNIADLCNVSFDLMAKDNGISGKIFRMSDGNCRQNKFV